MAVLMTQDYLCGSNVSNNNPCIIARNYSVDQFSIFPPTIQKHTSSENFRNTMIHASVKNYLFIYLINFGWISMVT